MSEKLSIPRRFRNIRKQISLFLLTAFVGFVGVVVLVAYKQGMFVQHTQIYFRAPDATGINKGMSVRLYGVPVGAVKDVELADGGGVRVRLGINTDYIPRLPRGSQARVTREGYVGAASIQIVTGTAGADRTPIAEGEEIKFIAQKGIADMLDEVRAQMTPAFEELRKLAGQMADPKGDFRKSVTAARELVEQLPEANREMRQLMRTSERTMATLGRQAETLGRQAEATFTTIGRVGSQAERDLPMLTGKLATTLDSINGTTLQLREVLNLAPDLMRGGGELVRDSQDLTAAARRTWLLRDYVEPSEMRTLPVDSFEAFQKRVP